MRVGGAAVDGAALAAGRLGVPQHGVGGDHHAVAGGVDPPAEVGVVAHQRQRLVEAAELLEDVAAHQHAGAGDGEHRADLVVLALVLLAAVQAGPPATGAGDGDADLQQLAAVVPAAQLGADHGGTGGGVGDLEQSAQRVGLRLAVVVQQPEPLDGLGLARAAAAEVVLLGERVAEVVPAAGDRVVAGGVEPVREVLRAQRRAVEDGLGDGGAEAARRPRISGPLSGIPSARPKSASASASSCGELSVEPVSTASTRWTWRSWPSRPARACGSQRAPSCETITAVTRWRG